MLGSTLQQSAVTDESHFQWLGKILQRTHLSPSPDHLCSPLEKLTWWSMLRLQYLLFSSRRTNGGLWYKKGRGVESENNIYYSGSSMLGLLHCRLPLLPRHFFLLLPHSSKRPLLSVTLWALGVLEAQLPLALGYCHLVCPLLTTLSIFENKPSWIT